MTKQSYKDMSPKDRSLTVLSVYIMGAIALGLVIGVVIGTVLEPAMEAADQENDNTMLIATTLSLAALVLFITHVSPKIIFAMMRREKGLKDSLKAVWTDDDGNDIPGIPSRIPEYKRTYHNKIGIGSTIYVAVCSIPVLCGFLFILAITHIFGIKEPEPGDIIAEIGFALLMLCAILFIFVCFYCMAYLLRDLNPNRLLALLSYKDNSREIELAEKDAESTANHNHIPDTPTDKEE